MATSKVTNCFSDFSTKEFDTIEAAATQMATEAGRATPLNMDYAKAVEGIIGALKSKLDSVSVVPEEIVTPPAQPVGTTGEGAGVSQPKQVAPTWANTTTATIPDEYSGPALVVSDIQAFIDAHPGAKAAVEALKRANLDVVFDEFDSIYIAQDSKAFDAKGSVYFDPATGTLQLWLDETILKDAGQLQFTIQHEVGHVLDGAFGGPGLSVYSGTTPMAMAPSGNASGIVARALKAEHTAQSSLGGVLDYPFNEKMSAPRKQEELLAQMFAVSLMGDKAQGFQKLPKVAQDFITKVIEHAQVNADRTISRARAAAESAAQSTARPNNQSAAKRNGPSQAATDDGQAAQGVGESVRRNLKSITVANPPYMYKAPSEVRAAAEVVVKTMRDWTFTRGAFTTDILEAAEKMGIASARQYRERINAAESEKNKLERKVSDILDRFIALQNHERNAVNALIKDSTMGNKWAFKPDWVPNFKSEWIDATLAGKYNVLTDDAKRVVEGVFRHGNDSLKEMQAAAMESIKSEVDPLIAQAKADGDMQLVKELEREKVAVDGKFKRMFELRGTTPYAPLRRFGNWAVVARSQALIDAIAAKDAATVKKLEASGDHYQVVFTDGRISAKARVNEIEASGQWGSVEHFERTDDNLLYGGDSMFKAFSRFRTLARSEMEGEAKKVSGAMDKVLASMYMQLLSETSARNAEHQRKNVMGADEDMMKAFATHGRAMAAFVGSLKTSGDVMDSLRQMGKEARGVNSDTKVMLYNEVLKRHAMGLDYEPNTLMDKALAANSFWSLVSSPSYILTNLTQPWVSSLPYMAGKWGYGKSFVELKRAYGDVAKLAAKLVKSPEAVGELPDDVREVVQKLFDRGSIDISLSQDLGQFESGVGALNGRLTAILRAPRTAAERAEMVNRVATAVAAYRLAQRTMGTDAATDYAQTVITRTHGDYTAVNAPRFMRSNVGRMMTQFRKFQLIQLSLYARMLKESLPSNMNAAERDAARRSLAYSLSTLFALGGITALPGFTAISFIMGSVLGLGDDDTPDDPEATLRRLFGGGAEADFLLRGVPNLAGLNVSNRIGAAGMLSILPYTDLEASRNGYKDILLGLAGPLVGGTLPKALDGVGLLYSGDVYKGMEMLLPRGLADVLKGMRFAEGGITKRNGDVVLSGEEIGALAGFAQAFGLPTTSITDTQMVRNTQYKADMFYKDRSSDIKRDYVEAYRSNDMEAMAAARAQWMETQQARKALGYDVQPLSSLLKAPQEQKKREAKPLNLELVQ